MEKKDLARDEKGPAAPPTANKSPKVPVADLRPSAEELARKAYFTYLNEGSPEGRHVQHWLDAEAHLIYPRVHAGISRIGRIEQTSASKGTRR